MAATRRNPVFGEGAESADLAFIGEGPGAREDELGMPFVGRSGQLLERLIEDVLHRSRADVFITNVVKCRPPENRDPTRGEVAACRGYLEAQLALVEPRVVVTLGNVATRTVLATTAGITALHGTKRSVAWLAAPIVPTFHPAAALRGGRRVEDAMRADLEVVAAMLE